MAKNDPLPEADRADGCAHPRETFDLMGHARAEETFLKAAASGRMHHAWLITGGAGVGKATLAYRMIRHLLGGKSLLSTALDIPAGDIVSGRIAAQGHGNLHVVRRPYDPKTKKIKQGIPVASIRKLTDFFQETAAEEGLPRIGLIDKADDLNTSSENAVLKLLEEPPKNGMLILLADAPGRLLPTIRSRCLVLDLRPIPNDRLAVWANEHSALSGKPLERAVWLSQGSPGRLKALEANAAQVLEPLSKFAEDIVSGRRSGDIALVSKLSGPKDGPARELFWGALQDLLAAYSRHSAGAAWTAPYPAPKTDHKWTRIWREAVDRQRLEVDINMDKRGSLLDLIGDMRAV